MTREEFTALVEDALREIPRRFRKAMTNVAVIVEDEPAPEMLAEMDIPPGDTLFGLYQGVPLPERGWGHGNSLPDRISIYQRPIEDACDDEEEIRDCVAETVIHEFGHYFGMNEEQIEAIEEKVLARRIAGRRVIVQAKKRLGQHFLESAWADRLVQISTRSPPTTFWRSARVLAR